MKSIITLGTLGVACLLASACAQTERTQPIVPSTTNTTSAPVPADTSAPSDDKPIPSLNLQSPSSNPPAASMRNTTSQAGGGDATPTAAHGNATSGAGQGTSDSDAQTTAKIRKSLDANNALSFGAKNVTILTSGGRVTLRGAVTSNREKAIVDATATKIAGASQIDNQLSVAK